jgi:hypothetical protein
MNKKTIELKFTRSPLSKINAKLKSICGTKLEIEIYDNIKNNVTLNAISLYDPESNPDFVICLNYANNTTKHKNCISSISCKINNDFSLEFSSKTENIYEGNKYNLLLRSVLIMVCPFIKVKTGDVYNEINSIVSRAINPISIYLLAKYFHANNELLEEYIEENNLQYDTLTFDNISDFYDNMDTMDFEDDKMSKKYMKNNEGFGNPILLTIDPNNEDTITQATKIFYNTAIKCPVEINGGSNGKLTKKRNKTHKNTQKRKKNKKLKKLKQTHKTFKQQYN